jgi:propionyl-CoA carboxylase beta chain
MVEKYRVEFVNPYLGASRGYVDDVIISAETRIYIIMSLMMLESKGKGIYQRNTVLYRCN